MLTSSCSGNAAYIFSKSVGEFFIRVMISHVTGNATIGFFLMLREREKIEHTNKRKSLASFSLLIIDSRQLCP